MTLHLLVQVMQAPDPDPEKQLRLIKLADNRDEAGLLAEGFQLIPEPIPPKGYAQKPPIPKRLRLQVLERDGFQCRQCGETENLCADHIIPEAKGGLTTLENLQTLCRSCNSRKGSR